MHKSVSGSLVLMEKFACLPYVSLRWDDVRNALVERTKKPMRTCPEQPGFVIAVTCTCF